MSELTKLVDKLVAEYGGGQAYFSAMDESVRRPEYFARVTAAAFERFGEHRVVTSGTFGREYGSWWQESVRRGPWPLCMPGGLRKLTAVDAGLFTPPGVAGQRFVFLDDSLYLGRTFDVVRDALARGGAKVVGGFVVYDGSTHARGNIGSLFRWHK